MSLTQSTATKSKIQTIGGINKKNIVLFLLVIGAMAGALAPFVHIVYPKTAQEKIQLETDFEEGVVSLDDYRTQKAQLKEKYKYLGFTNQRRFLFAIGLPVALFVASFFILLASKHITTPTIKRGVSIAGTSFMLTSVYFIIWTVWYIKKGSDFPRSLYYISMVVMATLTTFSMRLVVNGWYAEINKLKAFFKDYLVVNVAQYKKLLVNAIGLNEEYKSALNHEEGDDIYNDAFEEVLKKESREYQDTMKQKVKDLDDSNY